MTKDEALKLALEALKEPHPGIRTGFCETMDYWEKVKQAIAAIKEALAQPEQEPFTYYNPVRDAIRPFKSDGDIPLFTTPPKREWVGLTDEYIEAARIRVFIECGADLISKVAVHLARVIEASLKEKNT